MNIKYSDDSFNIDFKIISMSLDETCCVLSFLKRINRAYTYKFSELTKIKDLYMFLLSKLDMNYAIFDENLDERFSFIIKGEDVYANVGFCLYSFLCQHGLKDNKEIVLCFHECIGGGNGATIEALANIRINSSESQHKEMPHVHIYKSNYNEYVRVSLVTLTPMKNDKYNLSDFFSKKEIKEILCILKKYNNELLIFYDKIQKGEKPESFEMKYKNKIIIFK